MLFLAIRHLKQRKKQTLVTGMGVFLGTIAFVVVSGYTLGLEAFFKDRLLDNDGHMRISARERYLLANEIGENLFGSQLINWEIPPTGRKDFGNLPGAVNWYQKLKTDPRVEAFAPQLIGQVIVSRAQGSISAVLVGVKPSQQVVVTPRLPNSIVKGNFEDLATGGNRLILGAGAARKLGVVVGDSVQLVAPRGVSAIFRVVAIFAIGLEQFDNTYAYANLTDVQKLTGKLSVANEIAVRLKNRDFADFVANSYQTLSSDRVRSWKEINQTFVAIIGVQTGFRIVVIGILAVVIGFGIFNTLNISVTQKRKDIAILRSMGYSKSKIIQLFLIQGFALGFSGGLLGLPLGFFLCWQLSQIKFSEAAGNISISFSPWIYLGSLAVGVLSATLAGYLPARAAGKLDPIQVIRDGTE